MTIRLDDQLAVTALCRNTAEDTLQVQTQPATRARGTSIHGQTDRSDLLKAFSVVIDGTTVLFSVAHILVVSLHTFSPAFFLEKSLEVAISC